jgi:hypothetical protein
MITIVAVLSVGLATWLRFALGEAAPAVPWVGLAWVLLFARHSRRARFVASALFLGALEGLTLPAAWTVWPIIYLLVGFLAFGTRRFLAVQSAGGEVLFGSFSALLARLLALPFPAAGLPSAFEPLLLAFLGFGLTGIVTGVLGWMATRWVALRMKLTKVA